MTLSTENLIENTADNNTHSNNCVFVVSAPIRAYQNINLHSYSLLIDTQNAAMNFLASASCNQSYFEIHIYRSDEILYDSSKPIHSFLFFF